MAGAAAGTGTGPGFLEEAGIRGGSSSSSLSAAANRRAARGPNGDNPHTHTTQVARVNGGWVHNGGHITLTMPLARPPVHT